MTFDPSKPCISSEENIERVEILVKDLKSSMICFDFNILARHHYKNGTYRDLPHKQNGESSQYKASPADLKNIPERIEKIEELISVIPYCGNPACSVIIFKINDTIYKLNQLIEERNNGYNS